MTMRARTGGKRERRLDLSHLDLGAPAAERDIRRGLTHYFVESEAFHRVSSGAKTIILGNRGSGKSAIFQMLAVRARRLRNSHVIALAPEDYSYELLQRSLVTEAAGSWAKVGAYAAAWKYLLYVLVMKSLAKDAERVGKRDPLGRIARYVRDNHQLGQHSTLSALVSYLKRLEGIKIGPLEAGIKTRELEKLYKLEEINHLLADLEVVLVKQSVIVLIDELDRGWDASEDAQSFVAGLFQACVSMNSLSPNLTVYMSLRRELYDNIPALYEDAQKYRDMIEVIGWDRGGLQRLIARRVGHSLAEAAKKGSNPSAPEAMSDADLWNLLFRATLSPKRGASLDFLTDRTLYRPRELIQFCQEAVDEARESRSSAPLDLGVIRAAEVRYSEERTKDIAAEYRFQYPGLLNVFEVFRGAGPEWDRDDLEYTCLQMIVGDTVRDPAALKWLAYLDPPGVVDLLWQVGFLTAQPAGGEPAQAREPAQREGGQFVGSHQVRSLNLANVRRFQVHAMFRRHLGMEA
jgi:hypothetical protein